MIARDSTNNMDLLPSISEINDLLIARTSGMTTGTRAKISEGMTDTTDPLDKIIAPTSVTNFRMDRPAGNAEKWDTCPGNVRPKPTPMLVLLTTPTPWFNDKSTR
jgi:hypothetical protein